MRRTHKANFDYLQHYTYFVPSVPELMILVLWFIAGAVLGNAVSALFPLIMGKGAGMEVGMVVAYPVMFIPPMIYASYRSRKNCLTRTGVKVDSGNFGKSGGMFCAVLAAVGTVSTSFWADGVGSLLPEMPEFLKNILESMVSGNFLVNFLCVSIFAPVFEEWLCRGMVLRGLLSHNVKPGWAIVASALFFAVIHLNPWQAVPAFLMGCLFGLVYYRTGSLKLTMLMHFVNNTFALVLSRVPALEEMESFKDVFPAPLYYVVIGCSVIVTVLVALKFRQIEVKGGQGNLDEVPGLFEQ